MKRTGVVVNTGQGTIDILFSRPEACEKCGACGGEKHSTKITLPGHAQLGDRVEVDMEEGRVAQAALLAYIVPLALMLVGLLSSGALYDRLGIVMSSDLFAVICAGAGLLLAVFFLRVTDRVLRKGTRFTPRILAVYPKEEDNA